MPIDHVAFKLMLCLYLCLIMYFNGSIFTAANGDYNGILLFAFFSEIKGCFAKKGIQ